MQLLPLALVNYYPSSKTLSIWNDGYLTSSTSVNKCNPCQKFTDFVHKYKSFLKQLEYNDESSVSYSSGGSEVCFSKTVCTIRHVDLFNSARIMSSIIICMLQ